MTFDLNDELQVAVALFRLHRVWFSPIAIFFILMCRLQLADAYDVISSLRTIHSVFFTDMFVSEQVYIVRSMQVFFGEKHNNSTNQYMQWNNAYTCRERLHHKTLLNVAKCSTSMCSDLYSAATWNPSSSVTIAISWSASVSTSSFTSLCCCWLDSWSTIPCNFSPTTA